MVNNLCMKNILKMPIFLHHLFYPLTAKCLLRSIFLFVFELWASDCDESFDLVFLKLLVLIDILIMSLEM